MQVNRGRYRIGGLCGIAAAALSAGAVASGAAAQQTSPPAQAPAPTPTPSGRLPNVMYLPNTSLGGTPVPTPAPPPTVTVAPVATPTPAPRPAATATPRAAASERATPAPAPAQAVPAGQPSPASTPFSTQAPALPTPLATAPSAPAALPSPSVTAAPPEGMPGWLWALLGAGASALVFGTALVLRRRRAAAVEEEAYEPPVAAPAPATPARPVATPPGIAPSPAAPPPAPAAVPSGEPFEILLRPTSIEVTERDVLLDFEMLVGNLQASAAENIRVMMAMMSANPDQDRQIAGYHANPMVDPAGNAFDLASGAGGRMPARLALPRELIHVVEVQRRPMFVPLVMVELKWRAGISIRRFGADFMVGSAGQSAKLGPIWLDRNQQATQLAATRYLARQAAAA